MNHWKVTLISFVIILLTIALEIKADWIHPVLAQTPEPPADSKAVPTSAPPPPLSSRPFLPGDIEGADRGAIAYMSSCVTCHGDKGQGLTDEWREAGFSEDMNCWKAGCHESNQPNPIFNFPNQVPAITGSNTLIRFATAQELHEYIQVFMPWWDPDSLAEQDSWNLTIYLLRGKGVFSNQDEAHIKNAPLIAVQFPFRNRRNEVLGQFALASLLLVSTMAIVYKNLIFKDQTASSSSPTKRPNFFHHLHPPTIPLVQSRWRYTLGAGGMAVFLLLIITITGVLEMFFYIPTPTQAGPSIQSITFLVPYGGFVRGLHFWAAQALVVISAIHLLRTIFTAAYQPPRRFNFLLGLGLFLVIILMNFSGYMLRWDNGIHWALVVGTNMLKTIPWLGDGLYRFVIGGDTPGLATLTRFYAWHIFGLTIFLIILLIWHIFRVRRDGGISAPEPMLRPDPRRISRRELVQREVIAMLILSVALVLLTTLIPAPLSSPIVDASMPLNSDVRAPWFFLWVQQLLRHGNAFWTGIAIPLSMFILLGCLPYLFPSSSTEEKGIWFPRSTRVPQIITGCLILAWLTLTALELIR